MPLKTLPDRLRQLQTRIKPPATEGGNNRAHYQSEDHRRWASEVKRRDGYTCQKCGASGPDVRLIADHVVEIEDGGPALDLNNGMTLCATCHSRKTVKARNSRLSRRATDA